MLSGILSGRQIRLEKEYFIYFLMYLDNGSNFFIEIAIISKSASVISKNPWRINHPQFGFPREKESWLSKGMTGVSRAGR